MCSTESSIGKASPPLGLALSSEAFTRRFSTDQAHYQSQFMATIDAVSRLISNGEFFKDCLAYVANERNKMACKETNPFGILREKKPLFLSTEIKGKYKMYLDLFLKSSKLGWEEEATPEGISYTMFIQLECIPFPIKLTTIFLDEKVAIWKHTPVDNIHLCLTKAKALFDHAITLPNPHDHKSLTIFIEAVAELHWLVAHTCPYERGSAAIAKMLIGGILKSKGVEPGGFGDIEPDCMALIQSCEEFVRGYFGLMQFPPPHLILSEGSV